MKPMGFREFAFTCAAHSLAFSTAVSGLSALIALDGMRARWFLFCFFACMALSLIVTATAFMDWLASRTAYKGRDVAQGFVGPREPEQPAGPANSVW